MYKIINIQKIKLKQIYLTYFYIFEIYYDVSITIIF